MATPLLENYLLADIALPHVLLFFGTTAATATKAG
jgi:hypothetical protein